MTCSGECSLDYVGDCRSGLLGEGKLMINEGIQLDGAVKLGPGVHMFNSTIWSQ